MNEQTALCPLPLTNLQFSNSIKVWKLFQLEAKCGQQGEKTTQE